MEKIKNVLRKILTKSYTINSKGAVRTELTRSEIEKKIAIHYPDFNSYYSGLGIKVDDYNDLYFIVELFKVKLVFGEKEYRSNKLTHLGYFMDGQFKTNHDDVEQDVEQAIENYRNHFKNILKPKIATILEFNKNWLSKSELLEICEEILK